jgi:integrase
VEYVTPNCRQKTKERYEGIIRRHITPALGHIELRKLTPRDVQAFESKLSSKGMKPAGVEVAHNTLSGALKYALRMEVVWRNVVQSVTPPKVERKEVEPPEITIVRRILETARGKEHPLYPCLHLIAYTGVRRGEALGLRWQDVNLEVGSICISQTLGRSLAGLIFQPPKTNAGRRVIDLDDETVAVLRAHQGQQLLHKAQLEGVYKDQGLAFAHPLGHPINPMAVTRAYQSLAKKAGLEGANIHSLRHFHASVTLQAGQSIVTVSKRLGHASTSITADIYAHSMPGWQKEAANAFARAMREEGKINVGRTVYGRQKLGASEHEFRGR